MNVARIGPNHYKVLTPNAGFFYVSFAHPYKVNVSSPVHLLEDTGRVRMPSMNVNNIPIHVQGTFAYARSEWNLLTLQATRTDTSSRRPEPTTDNSCAKVVNLILRGVSVLCNMYPEHHTEAEEAARAAFIAKYRGVIDTLTAHLTTARGHLDSIEHDKSFKPWKRDTDTLRMPTRITHEDVRW